MGLGARMSTTIKAKLSRVLDKAEDPGETLDYSYQKQLENLQNVKKGIADVVTAKKRLQLQTDKQQQSIVKLDTQARQALAAGQEDLARTALERKTLIEAPTAGNSATCKSCAHCPWMAMNSLQGLDPSRPLFVSLNPSRAPDPALTFGTYEYDHPQFDTASLAAQRRFGRIQGRGGVWYAGAWLGYGFHEDGLTSGLRAAIALGGTTPWAFVDHRIEGGPLVPPAEHQRLRVRA